MIFGRQTVTRVGCHCGRWECCNWKIELVLQYYLDHGTSDQMIDSILFLRSCRYLGALLGNIPYNLRRQVTSPSLLPALDLSSRCSNLSWGPEPWACKWVSWIMLRGSSSGTPKNQLQFPYYLYINFANACCLEHSHFFEPIKMLW
jgi:hypothetical protein